MTEAQFQEYLDSCETTPHDYLTRGLARSVVSAQHELDLAGIVRVILKMIQDATPEASVIERLGRVEEAILRLEKVILDVQVAVGDQNRKKESYSTLEVAELLGKRPFTVREWCRLGRVRAEKSHSGRGAEPEWRIAHEEVVRIQNEGLLRQPSRY